eukprot:6118580-Prymnesium_polylepis.1
MASTSLQTAAVAAWLLVASLHPALGIAPAPAARRAPLAAAAAPDSSVVVMMAGRSRGRCRAPSAPRPPRVMKRSESGVPDIAACHPAQYTHLLHEKVALMEASIAQAVVNGTPPTAALLRELPAVEVFESARRHFRMRASFQMWREDDGLHFVMFNRDDARTPQEVVTYPMGSLLLNSLMGPLLDGLAARSELREKINDVRFLTTSTGDALVTVTYNRPIDGDGGKWEAAAKELADALGISIVGRSRNVKIVVNGETVSETLAVPGRGDCAYTQMEGAFTQPNAGVCESMLGWAFDATRGREATDLCELFCGNGCFTVALAPNFRRVIATEISKASVALAEANLEANSISNVRVARLSAEEFVEAHEGVRQFRRLEEVGIELGGAGGLDRLETLFVDPPRAGLDATCRALAAGFERIVYVSCNPETLARDVAELSATHEVSRLAAFDQFPYTPHLECGVVLERRHCD